MKDLQPTIAAVTRMLENEGLSIIPVMDKGTRVKMPPEKWNWKKYQSQQITMQELWGVMEKYDTSAIAIVCGAISGNLEVIDIDVKNWPGIDAILFKDIELLFPHIWQRLRIHKTPSGGYHILYKVIGKDVPGNKKLAAWENAPKNERGKPMYSLETRANGGYVVAPPSLNYSIYKNNEIPVISWEERCSLIAICESYDAARVPEQLTAKVPFKDDYYDENPFDHFNKSEAGSTIITEFGWTKVKESNRFIWFTRPGGTKGHVHASYNKDRNVYWVFTSNESLDEKGYNPSTILAHYKFNNDKKQCFRYLVEQGYGRIKPEREAALLARGKELPKNASQTAIQQRLEQEQQAQQVYPYGIFWSFDDKDKCIIDREGIYQVAEGLGFRIHDGELYRIEQPFVKKQTQRQFFDTVKSYIQEQDGDIYKEICNSYEAFLQKSGEFTSTRIRELETENILTDTEKECFKFYQNGILYITAEAISFLQYGTQLIWHHKVLQRDYIKQDVPTQHKYQQFLDLAIGLDNYVKQCIGYLCHDYKGEDEGYIIVLTEKCADPNQGGGSGKNIFGNILRNSTSVCSIGGEQIRFDTQFLQIWDKERIFFIADVPKKFNFSFLKDISTGHAVLKKLYENDARVTPDKMPKFLINTNFSVEITDGGLKRRIKWIEFTDFFTKCGGVKKHFGCMFPGGWTREDWIGFDNLIAESIQLYLQCNGTINNPELSAGGWEKQFKQTYGGNTFQFITENIENWEYKKEIEITDFNRQYQTFCTENNIQQRFELTAQRMNDAIADFCQRRGVKFERNKQISVNGLKQRFKVFTTTEVPF